MEVEVIVLEVPGRVAVLVWVWVHRRQVKAVDQRPRSGDFVVWEGLESGSTGTRPPPAPTMAAGRDHRNAAGSGGPWTKMATEVGPLSKGR